LYVALPMRRSHLIVANLWRQFQYLRIYEQGQIMLANQRVCLHFASLTNQNAWNSKHINKRSEKITPCSTPSVPFDIKLFTPKLTNSDHSRHVFKYYLSDLILHRKCVTTIQLGLTGTVSHDSLHIRLAKWRLSDLPKAKRLFLLTNCSRGFRPVRRQSSSAAASLSSSLSSSSKRVAGANRVNICCLSLARRVSSYRIVSA
jgi:hypothetical protein